MKKRPQSFTGLGEAPDAISCSLQSNREDFAREGRRVNDDDLPYVVFHNVSFLSGHLPHGILRVGSYPDQMMRPAVSRQTEQRVLFMMM